MSYFQPLRKSFFLPYCTSNGTCLFALRSQMEMSDRFRTAVNPHCRREQTPWSDFRKAEFRNSSFLKQLVKGCVQLPTDTVWGSQVIGCS